MMAFVGIVLIGLVIGLLARLLTPGPTPRGILVTIVIGIAGSVIATSGAQALALYRDRDTAGFIGSVVGAIVLIVLVRLLNSGR